MTLMDWATHVLQWRSQREAMVKAGANPEKPSQFGFFSATREDEAGITSNRGSARHGESVPGPCTPRPSRSGNRMGWKLFLKFAEILSKKRF
jgi:hypothetical protein